MQSIETEILRNDVGLSCQWVTILSIDSARMRSCTTIIDFLILYVGVPPFASPWLWHCAFFHIRPASTGEAWIMEHPNLATAAGARAVGSIHRERENSREIVKWKFLEFFSLLNLSDFQKGKLRMCVWRVGTRHFFSSSVKYNLNFSG